MTRSFWQISVPAYQRVIDVLDHRGAPVSRDPSHRSTVVFCMKRSNHPEQDEMLQWIAEIGAECRVEAAGSFIFMDFAKETEAVAFKLRWY